ncbi:ribosomal protein L17 [Phlebopus sp. FC_14]|nr:ribosomal protein L17 [Phlebopus sp. FC_14]
MKHGVAFRKFSRTSSHRNLMLRNLVSSLFEHEQIRTTLPKAKDTARLAEKMITLGKRYNENAYKRAQSFLLKPTVLAKLFTVFFKRYEKRPGGYTRIILIEQRPGDNAPMALLELVDNPNDFKLEMTARAVGRELLTEKLRWNSPRSTLNQGVHDVRESIAEELESSVKDKGKLRPWTRLNLQKAVKFQGSAALTQIENKASAHIRTLLAKPLLQTRQQLAHNSQVEARRENKEWTGRVEKFPKTSPRAGAAAVGETMPAMVLAQGALGRTRWSRYRNHLPRPSLYNAQSLQRR